MENDPLLLTPGPLTTALATKEAMLHDWGSWDSNFHELTSNIAHNLIDIANGHEDYAAILLQGSGTYAVEAAIGTLVNRKQVVLIPNNGAYCERIKKICKKISQPYMSVSFEENEPACADKIAEILEQNENISHVILVHCETSSGLLNPLEEIAEVCRNYSRGLIVDAMSTFGALPIDLKNLELTAVISSPNKCIEGVPGFGFVIAKKAALEVSEGQAHSLALDLYDQWQYFNKTKQWRYTPPTHCVAAFKKAIELHQLEGGSPGRLKRYRENLECLVTGMQKIGFSPLLPKAHQAPIIVAFHTPADHHYDFKLFYEKLKEKGFIIYPGKLTLANTFRVGCIGHMASLQLNQFIDAVADTVEEMSLKSLSPTECIA